MAIKAPASSWPSASRLLGQVSRPSFLSNRLLANKASATMSSKSTGSTGERQTSKDWSANQYLKFASQRTRPSRDLLAQVALSSPRRVLDIGCGPGNSTEVLVDRYPDAEVEGMDSSPDMIEKARKTLPSANFHLADLSTYVPAKSFDLMFSNAVFQWIPTNQRIPIMKKLIESLPSGGVFALQVPDNYKEPSHAAMRSVAEHGPWAEMLAQRKPGLLPFQTPQELYDELIPLCSDIDVWHTIYQHPLENHEGIVEWVKGTGLRPFIDPLEPKHREQFLAQYLAKLEDMYPVCADGKVLLRYPRLFLVAVRA